MKIKKGDEVLVLAGKDRYDRGKVQEVQPSNGTVTVTGVNTSKRHTKANPNKNVKGGIVEQLVPLPVGKVMLICPHCNKPARIGYRVEGDTKERFCKSCGQGLTTEGAD
ncbi:MAG TPA: 50S ribosomal protein L24 [Candidatus Limnocylindria bacterium]|jgi:large subunit ribosomal protein L24